MSIPVVVSDAVGCNNEFIDSGLNGFLCDPFADDPWVEVLVRLSNDAALRASIGARGHDTCRRLFDIRKTAARFEQIYAGLVV